MEPRQAIETFHLLFLRQLAERLPKDHYALKGGCNLRFYLKSIRYSEDMDFDIKITAKETLRSSVRKILKSVSLTKTLLAKGITLLSVSEPKQTETTQRWKMQLSVSGSETPIQTKVEFSRRRLDAGMLFEAVDPELIHEYALYPVYSTHYGKDAALRQKIDALIHRSEIQARDIFDLDLLLSAGAKAGAINGDLIKRATANVLSVGFAEFNSQVLAYLLPEYRPNYSKASWDALTKKILDALNGNHESP